MELKKCNGCKKVKPVSDFGKEKRALNGYKPRCKDCSNNYYNSKYKDIKENKSKTAKVWYQENKVQIIEKRMEYYHKNKKKIINRNKLYIRRRKIENPYLRTLSSFRTLVKKMLNNPEYSTFKYLGYSFEDLIKTLGKVPERTDHIDHKIPISWFEQGTELKLIFSLQNLQILTSTENISKGNRFCHAVSKKYYNQIKQFIKPKYLNLIKHD